jgi:hypothetical protein
MGYGLNFLNFRNGRMDVFPRDAIVSVLIRHGCRVSQLREGSNEIGLPDNEAGRSPVGESAFLTVKSGEATGFGLNRPQATARCRALLFSLVHEVGLTMFPDYGAVIYLREDVLREVPQDILSQFSNRILVSRPEDCAS